MVDVINRDKVLLNNPLGKFFNDYEVLITSDTDVYKEDGSILFKYRKKVVSEELQLLARETFLKHSKKINNQRGTASGGKTVNNNGFSFSSEKCRSSIVGYYDTVPPKLKKYFDKKTVCRQTSFTKNNCDAWNKSLPFFERIGELYKELSPLHYSEQMEAINKVNELFRISNTPFTTVTTNYNFCTACHKDSGDFGLGNLTVVGDDYAGGYLIFPEYRIAVDVRPGDFIIMDVHEYHCNSLLESDDNHIRLSFVCYLREKMISCTEKRIVNDEVYYV